VLEDSSVSSAGTEKHDVTIPLEKSWEASASPVEVKHIFMTQKNKKVPRPDKSHAEVLKKKEMASLGVTCQQQKLLQGELTKFTAVQTFLCSLQFLRNTIMATKFGSLKVTGYR